MVAERYQTFWPRFWAAVIDTLVFLPLFYVSEAWGPYEAGGIVETAVSIAVVALDYAYAVILHGRYGKTLGKMVTGVSVRTYRTEATITYAQAFLRDSPAIVLTVLSIAFVAVTILTGSSQYVAKGMAEFFGWCNMAWFMLELVTMLANDQRRAVHDFIAGTVVVRDSAASG